MMAYQDGVIEAVRKARPSVVQIVAQGAVSYDAYSRPVPRQGAGSGVVFDQRDVHDVRPDQFSRRERRPVAHRRPGRWAHLYGHMLDGDARSDLAVIRLEATGLPNAALGDSDRLEIGETVVAIGNALGLPGGPTVSRGVVSAKGRTIQQPNGVSLYDLIQTDAAINPGNSGGPLVNLQGEVVGINTAVIVGAEGIGFAIAINSLRPLLESLYRHGRIIRLWLGIAVTTATPALQAQYELPLAQGALIMGVEAGGPAAEAGLAAGDIIVGIAGEPVSSEVDLRRIIARREVDEKVPVVTQRGNQRIAGTVTIREMPRQEAMAPAGRRPGRARPQSRRSRAH
jgi:S1-C subfamily serine protease